MDHSAKQMLLASLTGALMFISVVYLSRRGRLSFRYTIGWICIAMTGILSGIFVLVVEPVAALLGFSAAGLVGLITLAFVVIISVQLSISISGLQRQLRAVAEEVARLAIQDPNHPRPNRGKE